MFVDTNFRYYRDSSNWRALSRNWVVCLRYTTQVRDKAVWYSCHVASDLPGAIHATFHSCCFVSKMVSLLDQKFWVVPHKSDMTESVAPISAYFLSSVKTVTVTAASLLFYVGSIQSLLCCSGKRVWPQSLTAGCRSHIHGRFQPSHIPVLITVAFRSLATQAPRSWAGRAQGAWYGSWNIS